MTVHRMKYNATVVRNNDDKSLGRIRVECRDLAVGELPFWVRPANASTSVGSGWFLVPEPDSRVVIEVVNRDTKTRGSQEAFLSEADAVYFPAPWSEKNPPGADFDTPQKRGYLSPSGHVMIFDDTPSAEKITLRHKSGSSYITFDENGKIVIHASEVDIDADADTHLLRGEDTRNWINTHKHLTPVGPSDVPTILLPTSALSSNHKVK